VQKLPKMPPKGFIFARTGDRLCSFDSLGHTLHQHKHLVLNEIAKKREMFYDNGQEILHEAIP